MTKYDALQSFRQNSPEVRFNILRAEMIKPITTSRGYSELIREKLITGECDNCLEWIEKIIEANDDLRQILDVLVPTNPQE